MLVSYAVILVNSAGGAALCIFLKYSEKFSDIIVRVLYYGYMKHYCLTICRKCSHGEEHAMWLQKEVMK